MTTYTGRIEIFREKEREQKRRNEKKRGQNKIPKHKFKRSKKKTLDGMKMLSVRGPTVVRV